jgi:hypothetical protein
MRPIGIARKATYSALFADLAWRKYRAEQYWLEAYSTLAGFGKV